MFNFFTKPPSGIEYTIKKYYKFEYIKRRYLLEVNKIKDYYRKRDRAVNNSHILSRMVNMLAPNYTADDFEYFKIVDSNAKYVSRQFGIVSNISKGKVFENELYRSNSSEILLYVESDIDLDTIKLTWDNKSPLRCIHSDSTIINFSFPYANVDLPAQTYTIYEIDVTLMLMMYKYWAVERVSNDMSINPNVFIATYVLPNTIDSMLDMSLFNRFLAIASGSKVDPNIFNPHPFTILNYADGIDSIYKDVLRDVRGEKLFLEQLLKSIPMVTEDDALAVTKVNHKYYTRQSLWVLWLAKIRTIRRLLYILGKKGRGMNRNLITRLPYIFKTILNRVSDIEDHVPEYIYEDFVSEITKVKKVLKR